MNFRDTGFLANATNEEQSNITAHAMYYQLGRYDTSNQFIKNYRNKDILELYKEISKTKLFLTNTLIKIYITVHTIEERMKLNRTKNNNKNKNKTINK